MQKSKLTKDFTLTMLQMGVTLKQMMTMTREGVVKQKLTMKKEFFDTNESLKSSSFVKQQTSDIKVDMELIKLNYPKFHRRKSLPQPKEKEKSVSLWSMIKDNIGKDLSKVYLPMYFNEPISPL